MGAYFSFQGPISRCHKGLIRDSLQQLQHNVAFNVFRRLQIDVGEEVRHGFNIVVFEISVHDECVEYGNDVILGLVEGDF
jgi:hypothetical protein